jgi:hypothetical protein
MRRTIRPDMNPSEYETREIVKGKTDKGMWYGIWLATPVMHLASNGFCAVYASTSFCFMPAPKVTYAWVCMGIDCTTGLSGAGGKDELTNDGP